MGKVRDSGTPPPYLPAKTSRPSPEDQIRFIALNIERILSRARSSRRTSTPCWSRSWNWRSSEATIPIVSWLYQSTTSPTSSRNRTATGRTL